MTPETVDDLGPVSYLVVEFPGNKMTGEGLPILVDLADRGVIRILDLLFVGRADDGTVAVLNLNDLEGTAEVDLAVFDGASSGLFDADDVAEAGAVLAPGSSAALLLFEHRWATGFVDALRRGGAELVAAGFVSHDALVAALDASEPPTADRD